MSARELRERFTALAMKQVSGEHLLQRWLELLEGNSTEHLPAGSLILPKAATDEHVIALQRLARNFHLGAEQPDVAHIMLRAGIRATGKMDVDRLIEIDAFLQKLSKLDRMGLRIGRREFAVGISRA